MSKIIAIANQKGGTGKTTTTLNFGAELAKKGYRVLLVDFDHQANLTLYCGISDFDEIDNTIADYMKIVMEGDTPEVKPRKYRNNIEFIASNVKLAKTNLELIQVMAREFVLKNLLEPLKEKYDYIFIDCAPSLSVDLINALTAADQILIVSNPAKFSASGTEELIKSILKVKKNLNKDLEISGVILNRVDRRNNFTKDMIEAMNESWGKHIKIFNTEIPLSIRVDESQAMGQPLCEYDPKNKLAAAYKAVVDEYLGN